MNLKEFKQVKRFYMKTLKVPGVDGDKSARLSLSFLLVQKKFAAEEAGGGEKALEKAALTCPDIILLDAAMPGMDGFETRARLKENQKTQDIPVIFRTAKRIAEITGKKVKLEGYMEKPFSIDELCAKISRVLENKKLKR